MAEPFPVQGGFPTYRELSFCCVLTWPKDKELLGWDDPPLFFFSRDMNPTMSLPPGDLIKPHHLRTKGWGSSM